MRISTRTHAYLDFATAGFALAFPRLLGASDRFTRVATAIALGKIGYALLTRHELGVVKILPMKTHLALDTLGGAAMCALPSVLDEENPAVNACAMGLGVFDIVAAPLTETRSKQEMPVLPAVDKPRRLGPVSGTTNSRLPQASLADSLKVTSQVIAPTVAKGPIIRRAKALAKAEAQDADTRAVQALQAMRARYGSGPLMLKIPFRNQAVILDPSHMRRVLDESPEPFATATREKRAALAHFEPQVSLVSNGEERAARRRLNDDALQSKRMIHPLAEHFLPVVEEEAAELLKRVREAGDLRWDDFIDAWFCMVRRIIFGNAARDDRGITDLMTRLRTNANWVILKPRRTDLREELHRRIRRYLERAEAGSLAGLMAEKTTSPVQSPEQQIPQWLFAFDPAAMATFRALGLLAAHPDHLQRAREEAGGSAQANPRRPLLRAAVLESLRLWPTTPMILRETTRATAWENGVMPAGTSILIFAPFFHRDEQRLPFAHTFHPEVWIEDDPEVKGSPPRAWPLVPFSGGPAHCPGQNLVLLLTSAMLAALIRDRTVRLVDPQRMPPGRLPGTQNHYTLRFELQRRENGNGGVAASATTVSELRNPP